MSDGWLLLKLTPQNFLIDMQHFITSTSIPFLMKEIGSEIINQKETSQSDWPQGNRRGIQCTIEILRPLELLNEEVPKLTSASPDSLTSYALEVISGTADEARENINCYSYHKRMVDNINQLDLCIFELKRNPDSNRAVITLGREEDIKLADLPCLRHIQFKIRDGRLEMTTIWRSRDFCQAWYMNIFALINLGALIAARLGIKFGKYSEYNEDLHCYANSYDRLTKFVQLKNADLGISYNDFFETEDIE